MSRCSRYAPVALSVCVSVWIGWSLFGIRHPVALRIINIPDTAPGATAVVKVTGEEQQYCDGVAHRWLLDRNGGYYPLPDTAVFHPARNKVVTFYHEFTVPGASHRARLNTIQRWYATATYGNGPSGRFGNATAPNSPSLSECRIPPSERHQVSSPRPRRSRAPNKSG